MLVSGAGSVVAKVVSGLHHKGAGLGGVTEDGSDAVLTSAARNTVVVGR